MIMAKQQAGKLAHRQQLLIECVPPLKVLVWSDVATVFILELRRDFKKLRTHSEDKMSSSLHPVRHPRSAATPDWHIDTALALIQRRLADLMCALLEVASEGLLSSSWFY